MSSKRQVPTPLRKLLDLDAKLSEKFCLYMNQFLPFRSLRIHYKTLEITCHGLVWLAGWLAFIWLVNSPSLYQMQVNFYLGLFVDIIFVALIKAFVRRKRPSGNVPDMFATFGPDVYSFPSGHVSRGTFIMLFFMLLYPLPIFCFPPLAAWVTSLSLSRVLMRRHHILDVLAGLALGALTTGVISLLWLSRDTCLDMLSFLSGEKLAGESTTSSDASAIHL